VLGSLRRSSPWSTVALISCLLSVGSGCATAVAPKPAVNPKVLLAEAKRAGLEHADPLYIDEGIQREIEANVSPAGAPEQRLRGIVRYLVDSGHINFEYQPDRSLTAEEAFHQRRGDCMSFSNLFMALARHMGIFTYFVHVQEVRNYYERDGFFFVSSHVAVGYGSGPVALVFDFTKELSDWKLSVYQAIDDSDALALYYNNIAVDHMVRGRTAHAEKLFSFWLERSPRVAELYNNYGVLLNRTNRSEKALHVLLGALERYPEYEPLYTNGLLAARKSKNFEVTARLEKKSHQLEERDPFFLFARAMGLYQDAHFTQAAAEFERARSAKPDSPVILAWLTRAYLAAGRQNEGLEAFERMQTVPLPDKRLEQALTAEFPLLRARISN